MQLAGTGKTGVRVASATEELLRSSHWRPRRIGDGRPSNWRRRLSRSSHCRPRRRRRRRRRRKNCQGQATAVRDGDGRSSRVGDGDGRSSQCRPRRRRKRPRCTRQTSIQSTATRISRRRVSTPTSTRRVSDADELKTRSTRGARMKAGEVRRDVWT